MENEYVKFHVLEQYINRDISVKKISRKKIQFHMALFSSNQINGILFVSIYSLNT